MDKEYLYVGHYMDLDGKYILKVGTTKDLDRRQKEHTRSYRKASKCPMSLDSEFVYDWHISLSKYNTLRYEDKTKALWKEENLGEFIRNDRFKCAEKPSTVSVIVRKIYEIIL